jgi:hypothetical protein
MQATDDMDFLHMGEVVLSFNEKWPDEFVQFG